MRFPYFDLFPSSSSLVQNLDSYFNLDSKQPASSIVSTSQPSQLSSSHSPFSPSIPPGFSSVSSQPLYASTFVHPQSSNARSHSKSVPAPTSIPVNTHPMQTRSKSEIHNPRLHPSLFLGHSEPKTIKQALENSNWFAAMQEECDALLKNRTWNSVPLPLNRQAIRCKWVFMVKENPDGSINKFKTKLVAKGFHQVHGFDLHETFFPQVKLVTIRVVLTLAFSQG